MAKRQKTIRTVAEVAGPREMSTGKISESRPEGILLSPSDASLISATGLAQ
jgi:hypothetical protein